RSAGRRGRVQVPQADRAPARGAVRAGHGDRQPRGVAAAAVAAHPGRARAPAVADGGAAGRAAREPPAVGRGHPVPHAVGAAAGARAQHRRGQARQPPAVRCRPDVHPRPAPRGLWRRVLDQLCHRRAGAVCGPPPQAAPLRNEPWRRRVADRLAPRLGRCVAAHAAARERRAGGIRRPGRRLGAGPARARRAPEGQRRQAV
ncbi:hypothetical protein H4R21_003329, partial [Coemansia helicoidea]